MLNRLLLITQLHRSGGTLFSQLLDGHSAIQAHPHELFIGKPKKWDWPDLQAVLKSPNDLFDKLQEPKIAAIGRAGIFIKPGSNPDARKQTVPFTYDIDLHRQIFCDLYSGFPAKSQRLAIQLYLATFFRAWPEYKSSHHERYVSCFLPHLIIHSRSVTALLADFPDILLVSLIRRPDSWISSLVNHLSLDLSNTQKIVQHLERWRLSVDMILKLHSAEALHTFTSTYEHLVCDTRAEMVRFASCAGIPFEPILLLPTVGGYPVLPNSSYSRTRGGVNQASVEPSLTLPEAVSQMLYDNYTPVYQRAIAELGLPPMPVRLSES